MRPEVTFMDRKSKSAWWRVPLLLAMGALALWATWAVAIWVAFPAMSGSTSGPVSRQEAMAMRGQFGDLFGGVNALFTALILAGAAYGIRLQHKEVEGLTAWQERADRRSDEAQRQTATLMAHAALVSARAASLDHRYKVQRDAEMRMFSPHLLPADVEEARQMLNVSIEVVRREQLGLERLVETLTRALEHMGKDKAP
jgi:hypothetical protein